MGDVPGLADTHQFIVLRIAYLVCFAEALSALAVNLGRSEHVQTLVGAIIIIFMPPTLQPFPLGW